MIEQPTSIPWSEEYSDEDEMIDFVAAASEMLEELLARPQPNYLRSRLIHRSGSACLNSVPRFISGLRAVAERCRVVHGGGRRLRRTDRRGGQLGAHPGAHVTRPALLSATPPAIFPPA